MTNFISTLFLSHNFFIFFEILNGTRRSHPCYFLVFL
nr:MAG TPA: hypothetical protein [Caudoviricetes sp.]